jgi:Flp pilus assembly protein TadG
MRGEVHKSVRQIQRDTQGGALVEFAVIALVSLLIVFGIIDFGHAIYINYVIGGASQEGARYGSTYRTDGNGKHVSPSNLTPSIQDYVLNQYLGNFNLPGDANPQVTVGGTGYTTGIKGDDLIVTVTATKNWFVISHLVPGMGEQITLSNTYVVRLE